MDSWTEKYFESFLCETISFPGNHIELVSGLIENGHMYSAWTRPFLGSFYIKGYLVTKELKATQWRQWHTNKNIGRYYIEHAKFSGGWEGGNKMQSFQMVERSDLEWFLCRMMQGALQ